MIEGIENIDYVVCQFCSKQLKRITKAHLKHHACSKEEYELQFPGALFICQVYLQNLSKGVKDFHQTELGKEIRKNIKKRTNERRKNKKQELLKSFENKIENIDYVVCQICAKKFNKINTLHLKIHNLLLKDYQELFPNAIITSEKSKQLVSNTLKERSADWIQGMIIKNSLKQEETSIKTSDTLKQFWNSEEGKLVLEERNKKLTEYWNSEEGKQVLKDREEKYDREDMAKKSSQTLLDLFQTEEGKKILEARNAIFRSPEERSKRSERALKAQTNPLYWEKQHKSKSKENSPNGFEREVIKLLPSSFKFTGDKNPEGVFEFINGHSKNADFTFHNKTKVIECFGNFWHTHPRNIGDLTPEEHEREIVKNYKDIGIDCLVIWENEIKIKDDLQLRIHKWLQPTFYNMN